MHLTPDDVMKAARIAAAKYFSTDQAICQEDLSSIALVRILERDPTTMGTAVHVGREGIMREIKYQRYAKATQTIQLSVLESDGERASDSVSMSQLKRLTQSEPQAKFDRYVHNLTEQMGPPDELFGKFGFAYSASKVSDSLVSQFKSRRKFANREKRIVYGKLTDELRLIAESEFVLAVIPNGKPLQTTINW